MDKKLITNKSTKVDPYSLKFLESYEANVLNIISKVLESN